MTRMCSYAKISKGGAGSVDELRDTGSIILCYPQIKTFFFFFSRRNEQRAKAQESCCASRTCCLLLTVINWNNNNNKKRKCVYQRWKTRSQIWMLGTSSTDTDYRLNLTLISLHMTWDFSRLCYRNGFYLEQLLGNSTVQCTLHTDQQTNKGQPTNIWAAVMDVARPRIIQLVFKDHVVRTAVCRFAILKISNTPTAAPNCLHHNKTHKRKVSYVNAPS